MSPRKKRVIIIVIVCLAVLVPAIVAASVFYWVGANYRDAERIYPNISIAGTDVSWMTPEEALEALNLDLFEQRVSSAQVTVLFPDDTELTIRGEDINLTNDAQIAVDDAFSLGRGNGFIQDTISFIKRYYDKMLHFNVYQIYDIEILNSCVDTFVEEFNAKFIRILPQINGEEVIITKGAGQELIDVPSLKDITYIGLFESFEAGHPVEIEFTLPETKANTNQLLAIQQVISKPAQSAILDTSTLVVSNSAVGTDFDLFNAIEMINNTETGKTVSIPISFIEPEITREHLESMLFRDLIGECTTWVHGSADRVTNVRISSETVNGTILRPGDEFSFNDIVGVRSTSKGYRPGGAFVDGVTVSVIGGGICQTSSTLHSAIMDTEIKITDRKPHGQPIPYLPRGRDATVFWGKQDFKFVNNTEFPLRIDFELDNRNLTVKVYGTIIDDFPTPSLPTPAG